MIVDLTLKEKLCFLKIHKKFFINESCPLSLFCEDNALMEKYSFLGKFDIEGAAFGFAGCFKKKAEEGEYFIYTFSFPKPDDRLTMRRMILSVYLATYYVLDQMYYCKEFFDDGIWEDQSLSFVIFNGADNTYPIGGTLYPWFKKSLEMLCKMDLVHLNMYVFSELNRWHNYFLKKELCMSQITISRQSFFIQINMGGRWIFWKKNSDNERPEEFDSHNIDFSVDQELCFAAVIAMNTWLRKKMK